MKKELLEFVKENVSKISKKIGCDRIEFIFVDVLGDVSGVGIYEDEDGDEMEGGLSFRWSKDIDDEFVGENGDDSVEIKVGGEKISYIGYNI